MNSVLESAVSDEVGVGGSNGSDISADQGVTVV